MYPAGWGAAGDGLLCVKSKCSVGVSSVDRYIQKYIYTVYAAGGALSGLLHVKNKSSVGVCTASSTR